jgi:DtxR family Mn-dependent transcriptional regulator
MMNHITEERYLKAIYHIRHAEKDKVKLSAIAAELALKPPTVHEQIKRLSELHLVKSFGREGLRLTKEGDRAAISVVRRHRIWETFLHKICRFSWSEVHELAEQLQHIRSEKLIDRIYEMSGSPEFDPHGDPIPDKSGSLPHRELRALSESIEGCRCVILGVTEDSTSFLNYLTDVGLGIHDKLVVQKRMEFDGTWKVRHSKHGSLLLTDKVASKIQVVCKKPGCACTTALA